jgi:FixJ family two-component response regulator
MLRKRCETLSKRELGVALVTKEMMNNQVGGALGISEVTVKAHREKALQKMQAASLVDLVKIGDAPGITASPSGQVRLASKD